MRQAIASFLADPFARATRLSPDLALAAGVLGILFVILVPVPPALIDPLLVLNLTVSLVVLLTAVCVTRPLELSVFPSLLLITTFFRLGLNIATTRLILGNAAEGPYAAGHVVHAFGASVAGDNPIVGFIVFLVIVVVQFVVVTKGAARVSEVAARFVLDAMPGKQVSIDGDLASGLISQETAKARRQDVAKEADFYGAMDGASKFVRGDAVAGLLIVAINLVGGVAVGFCYHDMELAAAAEVFCRLTIGDGLVTQIPALMVSVAAALLVTRSGGGERLGRDFGRQVFADPGVILLAAVFLLLLLPSGLPPFVIVVAAAACVAGAVTLWRSRRSIAGDLAIVRSDPDVSPGERPEAAIEAPEREPADLRSLLAVDPIALEFGYRLLPLVDGARGGDLLERMGSVRERIAVDLGLVLPGVQLRDSRAVGPSSYSLKLRGIALGVWDAEPHGFLAVAKSGEASGDPANLPAPRPGPAIGGAASCWLAAGEIDPDVLQESWELRRPAEAIALHVEGLLRAHAAELLTREEVSSLLEGVRMRAASLVDDLVPAVVRVSDLHRILQGLLREGVSIRDLERILEALGGDATAARSPALGVELARRALARTVCLPACGKDGKLHGIVLDAALEEFLASSLEEHGGQTRLALDPETAEALCLRAAALVGSLRRADCRLAVLTPARLRPHVAQMIGPRLGNVVVLSYDEIVDESAVAVHGSLSLTSPGRISSGKREALAER